MAANTANQFLQIPHNGAYGNKSVQVIVVGSAKMRSPKAAIQ